MTTQAIKINRTIGTLINKKPQTGISAITTNTKNPVAMTNSWKCCKCRHENYHDKWVCNDCKHERCKNCKNLLG